LLNPATTWFPQRAVEVSLCETTERRKSNVIGWIRHLNDAGGPWRYGTWACRHSGTANKGRIGELHAEAAPCIGCAGNVRITVEHLAMSGVEFGNSGLYVLKSFVNRSDFFW